MEVRNVYMNHLQQRIYYAGARDIRAVCARRFGKTDGIIGPQVKRVVDSMPQGAGIWAGNSRKQLFTRTVPATIAAIERFWGLREGVHFWWGRPPEKLGVPRPIIKPKDWSHVITFYNGFVWHLVSLETRGSANSMTVNYIIVDEARFIKKEKYDAEVQPTLSGITHPVGHEGFTEYNPFYKGTLIVSDAGLSQRENWMEKEEEKCDQTLESGPFKGKTSRQLQAELDGFAEKVIRYNNLMYNAKKNGREILVADENKIKEIKAIAESCFSRTGPFKILPAPGVTKQNVDMLVNYKVISADDARLLFSYEYLITKFDLLEIKAIKGMKSYKEHIRKLRCNTFAFYRGSTLDNIDLLGPDYIAKMKRDLPPVVYAISILNMKKQHSSDGFYSKLDIDNLHGYVPEDCPAVEKSVRLKIASREIGGQTINTDYETPDFDELQRVKNCTLDGDVVPHLPLHIAFDYNANINWVVTGQVRHDPVVNREALMVLSSMFVKNERKLGELVDDWNKYYAPHKATCRDVYFYYDSTAKHKGYAMANQQDFKDLVIEKLRKAGWNVIAIDMGRPMEHRFKHKDINEALAGVTYPFIRINKENNEALIVAMENTGVRVGSNGFEKDKSKEKYVETEVDPLELRTDGTDAFDSLFIGVKHFRYQMAGICMPVIGNL